MLGRRELGDDLEQRCGGRLEPRTVEAEELTAIGVRDPLGLILVDPSCLVTTPVHAAVNRAREILRGDTPHGSCGLGVGETAAYALATARRARRGDTVGDAVVPNDVRARSAPRVDTLLSRNDTVQALDHLMFYAEPLLEQAAAIDSEAVALPHVADMAKALTNMVDQVGSVSARPVWHVIDELLQSGTVVFEGSQGVLLDEHAGFHPHTTWSTTHPRRLAQDLFERGTRPYVLGVTRVYGTRHGAGPFPTEDPAQHSDEPHNREGRYQGAWREGHLDLVGLRYAALAAGVDGVAVSHLDVVGRPGALVAHGWDGEQRPLTDVFLIEDDEPTDAMLRNTETAFGATPDYLPAPHTADGMVELIEETAEAPVVLTADGPRRVDRRFR